LKTGRTREKKGVLSSEVDELVFEVDELVFEVNELVFEVNGLGFEVNGLGFEVNGLGFEVNESVFEVDELGFEVNGLGFEVDKLGFKPDASSFNFFRSPTPQPMPLAIQKASPMGPNAKAGKNVSAPRIRITPAVTPVNNPVSVRNVPAV
jgi:hypothetical protein